MIWSLLRTRRWLGFTALVVFVIVAFGLLSLWQLQRADVKREQRIELARLAYDAGTRALSAAAWASGHRYLEFATELIQGIEANCSEIDAVIRNQLENF